MLTRRTLLGWTGAAAASRLAALPSRLAAAEMPVLSVGVLEFGTVGWEIDTIRRYGLAEAAGLDLRPVKLASNDAARIAFLGGNVDTIVTDLLWVARLRGEGRDLVFLPFSATEGAVMVPAASRIRSVADLAGARLGVAGGALDKSWLLLQGFGRKTAGLDLARSASPAFAAPPLLSHKLEAGELDAALLYWTFCARLEAKGFRRLIGVDELAAGLGASGEISFLGYVFDRERLGGRVAAIAPFAAASRAAKTRLAGADDAWTAVRPLMQAEDEATFETLKRHFIAGIPRRSSADEEADARRIYATLAELGGEALVGRAAQLPAGLFWTGAG